MTTNEPSQNLVPAAQEAHSSTSLWNYAQRDMLKNLRMHGGDGTRDLSMLGLAFLGLTGRRFRIFGQRSRRVPDYKFRFRTTSFFGKLREPRPRWFIAFPRDDTAALVGLG
jgi:hypothetical protein